MMISSTCYEPPILQAMGGYFSNMPNDVRAGWIGRSVGLFDQPYPPSYNEANPFDIDHSTKDLTQFQRFLLHLHKLNSENETADHEEESKNKVLSQANKVATDRKKYKVLFLIRHGEGFHNAAETRYGTIAWEKYWAKLPGDPPVVWADAALTEKGKSDAVHRNRYWKHHTKTNDLIEPDIILSSPLHRALETTELLFRKSRCQSDLPPIYVYESIRETTGVHTCDQRHPKSWIASHHPSVIFPSDFSESDPLWTEDHRETEQERLTRLKTWIAQNLFESVPEGNKSPGRSQDEAGDSSEISDSDRHNRELINKALFVAIVSHSGTIRSILAAVGHPPVNVATIGIFPVVVRAHWKLKNDPENKDCAV